MTDLRTRAGRVVEKLRAEHVIERGVSPPFALFTQSGELIETGGGEWSVTGRVNPDGPEAADIIEALLAELDAVRDEVARLYCASGCSCCRDNEGWHRASMRLGELLEVPHYEDCPEPNWYAVRDAANEHRSEP